MKVRIKRQDDRKISAVLASFFISEEREELQ